MASWIGGICIVGKAVMMWGWHEIQIDYFKIIMSMLQIRKIIIACISTRLVVSDDK